MIALARPMLALGRGPIARASMQSVAIRLTGLTISFVQGVLAARLLGVEGYGIVSVALSLANVLATLALFGWGPLAVRQLAQLGASRRGDLTGAFVKTSLRWVTALAIVAGAALSAAGLTGLLPYGYRDSILAGGLLVLPLALLQLQRGVAQGLGKVVVAQAPGELLRPGLFVGFLALAMAMHWTVSPQGFLAVLAAVAFAAMVVALPFTLRGVALGQAATADRARRQRWVAEAMPFLGITLVGMLLGEITTLMLGWLAAPEQAGLFQPVARLVPVMILPAQVVAFAFAPRVADLWARGERERVERLTHTFTLVTSAMTVVLVGLLILSGPLIMRAFGPEFMPSAALLWIVGVAQLLNAAAGPVGHLLAMTGHAPIALRGQMTALAANVLVGMALIPSQGAYGAVIAMAVGLAVWNLVLLLRARKLLGFDPSLSGALRRALAARR